MRFYTEDLRSIDLRSRKYNLGIFASGYEERCTHVAQYVLPGDVGETFVLGFQEHADDAIRMQNDEFFRTVWKVDPTIADSDDDSEVYRLLSRMSPDDSEEFRILVDYSSMSRVWWTALLNWARYFSVASVKLDFVYCPGVYEKSIPTSVIKGIAAIPGCEGGASKAGETAVVIGLGFSGAMPLCVLEYLEPDDVYAVIASPGATPKYVERVKRNNHSLLERAEAVLEAPIWSVSLTARYLRDIVTPLVGRANVVLVPMGPKPHVLASVLVGLEYPEVCCLRVSTDRAQPITVPASGEYIVTRVEVAS